MDHIFCAISYGSFYEKKRQPNSKWLNHLELASMGRQKENLLADTHILVKYEGCKEIKQIIYYMWSGCLLKSEYFRHYLETINHGFQNQSILQKQVDQLTLSNKPNSQTNKFTFEFNIHQENKDGFEIFLDLISRFLNEEDLHEFLSNDSKNIYDKDLLRKTFENCKSVQYFSRVYTFPIINFLCSLIIDGFIEPMNNILSHTIAEYSVTNIVKLNLTEVREIKLNKLQSFPKYIEFVNLYSSVDVNYFEPSLKGDLFKKFIPDFKSNCESDITYHDIFSCKFCNFKKRKKLPNNFGIIDHRVTDIFSIITEFDKNVHQSLKILQENSRLGPVGQSTSFFVHKYQTMTNVPNEERWNLTFSYNSELNQENNGFNDNCKKTGPYIKIGNIFFCEKVFNISIMITSKIIKKKDGTIIVQFSPNIIIDVITNHKNIVNRYPPTQFFKKILVHEVLQNEPHQNYNGQVLFTHIPSENYDVFYPFKQDDLNREDIYFKDFKHDENKVYNKNDVEYSELFNSKKVESPIVDFSEYSLIHKVSGDKIFIGMNIVSEQFGISKSKRIFLNLNKLLEITNHKKSVVLVLPDIKLAIHQKTKKDNFQQNNVTNCCKHKLMKGISNFVDRDSIIMTDEDMTSSSSDEGSQINNIHHENVISYGSENDEMITCDNVQKPTFFF